MKCEANDNFHLINYNDHNENNDNEQKAKPYHKKSTAKAVIIKKFVTYHNRIEPKKLQIKY